MDGSAGWWQFAATVAATFASAGGAYAAVRAEIRHLMADIQRHDTEISQLRAQLMQLRD